MNSIFYFENCFIRYMVTTLILMQSMFIEAYTIEVTKRHLYGPGPFPDQQLKTAWIKNLHFDKYLTGKVIGVNNLGQEPNVSGEVLQGKKVDGMLSDGTLINEDIDMSNAVIMNGQFNLLLAAVFDGPNRGDTFFYLDDKYNWWIKDDIAIDPGFAEGIVKIHDFTFSTMPRIIPDSLQTERGYPGGTNKIGSISSGRLARGRLGDSDKDGYLDGVFNAIGRFPMEAIFLPGAPFVQLFEFKSDIPVSSLDDALLNMASMRSHNAILEKLRKHDPKHMDIQYLEGELRSWKNVIHDHVTAIRNDDLCQSRCSELISLAQGSGPLTAQLESIYNIVLELKRNENAKHI